MGREEKVWVEGKLLPVNQNLAATALPRRFFAMSWTANAYVYSYGFSWGYYYCAGFFGYGKTTHTYASPMGILSDTVTAP